MEAALILGLLGYGAHQYIGHPEAETSRNTQYMYSTQTTESISEATTQHLKDKSIAQIDWSKAGNFVHGDSPATGVQWVFVTGN